MGDVTPGAEHVGIVCRQCGDSTPRRCVLRGCPCAAENLRRVEVSISPGLRRCSDNHPDPEDVERIARAFHEAYEQLAPLYGYSTREASAKPWEDVPHNNRALMRATVGTLIHSGEIHA